MTRDWSWPGLLDHLNTWGAAREVAPGRIALSFDDSDGTTRQVELVITADEWSDFASTIWGDSDDAAHDLRRMVVEAPRDQRFLVYGTYELVPSPTPELPADPEEAAMDEMARQHPEGFGRWVVPDDEA